MQSTLRLGGSLAIRHIRRHTMAPLSWRLRNWSRPGYVWGVITTLLAVGLTRLTGIPTLTAELRAVRITADGQRVDHGVVSRRVVTTVGAGAIVDAFQNSFELENFNYHGCGTGGTAEAVGDTALVTESTTALNPDSTRATGT